MEMLETRHAEFLNTCCACQTLNAAALQRQLSGVDEADLVANVQMTHPHLFAHERVFISASDLVQIRQTIETIDAITGRAAFREMVFGTDEARLGIDPGTRGVFCSYDFHLTATGPALIEINTNAGGAFLAAAATAAHDRCCTLQPDNHIPRPGDFTPFVAAMFESEWRLAGRTGLLKTIVIIDDEPAAQFLYPDFLLARASLRAQGYDVQIADAGELEFRDGRLQLDGQGVDLVYNRLTDFGLDAPKNRALRAAVDTSASVVTPHPFHHALLADKRNLVRLTDPDVWDRLALGAGEREVLGRVPRAEFVTEINAERLWADRRNLFFKPFSGHAGKGVYRGDKLTKSTWAIIRDGGYIAQARVNPSVRKVLAGGENALLKTDIRAFTYGAEIFLAAARLYQGQVTNMRTPAGGFAPVSIGFHAGDNPPKACA